MIIVQSNLEFSFKISFPHFRRHGFCKLFNAHFFDQAEIVNLEIVWVLSRPVGVWLVTGAGEIVTLAANFYFSFLAAFKYGTGFCLLVAIDDPLFSPTTGTGGLINGDSGFIMYGDS